MPQVVRTVNDLLVQSLYLSGELGVGETPDGFMLSTGLDLLNEILDKFSGDGIYIPFLTTINFDLVAGKDTYSVSDMVTADITADRILDLSFANYVVPSDSTTNLIYPLRIINKATYYNVLRQNNLSSRPAFIFLNKQDLESYITVYPVPNQNYPCTIQVKSMINMLQSQDTLGELPPNYYGFLKLALCMRWSWYYPSSRWTQDMQKEYDDYYETFKSANETDLTLRPSVIVTSPGYFYWYSISSY